MDALIRNLSTPTWKSRFALIGGAILVFLFAFGLQAEAKCSIRAADPLITARYQSCKPGFISYLYNDLVTPYSFTCAKKVAATCQAENCANPATEDDQRRCYESYVLVLNECERQIEDAAKMARCTDTRDWAVATVAPAVYASAFAKAGGRPLARVATVKPETPVNTTAPVISTTPVNTTAPASKTTLAETTTPATPPEPAVYGPMPRISVANSDVQVAPTGRRPLVDRMGIRSDVKTARAPASNSAPRPGARALVPGQPMSVPDAFDVPVTVEPLPTEAFQSNRPSTRTTQSSIRRTTRALR